MITQVVIALAHRVVADISTQLVSAVGNLLTSDELPLLTVNSLTLVTKQFPCLVSLVAHDVLKLSGVILLSPQIYKPQVPGVNISMLSQCSSKVVAAIRSCIWSQVTHSLVSR